MLEQRDSIRRRRIPARPMRLDHNPGDHSPSSSNSGSFWTPVGRSRQLGTGRTDPATLSDARPTRHRIDPGHGPVNGNPQQHRTPPPTAQACARAAQRRTAHCAVRVTTLRSTRPHRVVTDLGSGAKGRCPVPAQSPAQRADLHARGHDWGRPHPWVRRDAPCAVGWWLRNPPSWLAQCADPHG